ncbi:MAG: cysteine desulfurase family protein [Verrucomicrobiota bacterium]
MRSVFLDHQSTTPVLPEVFEAMRPFFSEHFGSPASLHRFGVRVRDALAEARSQVAAFIHAESAEEILFTSGATESANLAVKGVALANQRRGRHLIVSATEHPAVLQSIDFLEKLGFTSTPIPVDGEGRIDPESVRRALTDETILVCVHHVNHDLGTIEPIREISAITADRGVPLFVDAAASGGWMPIDVQELGADLLSLSPHRFYGPKGVGILFRQKRVRLSNVIHGGVQEGGLRAGTENVPAIVGAGVAAAISSRELAQRQQLTGTLQRRLWTGLKDRIDFVHLNGPEPGPHRLSTNLNVSFEFLESEGIALSLDVAGVAVASGASCVSKAMRIPPVLAAIGLPQSLAQGNVIFSLGRDNTPEEIDSVIETVAKVVQKLRAMSPLWDDFEKGLIDSVIAPRTRERGHDATGRRG